MNSKEIKKAKVRLRNELFEAINKFESKTKVHVIDVQFVYEGGITSSRERSKPYLVNIEITL